MVIIDKTKYVSKTNPEHRSTCILYFMFKFSKIKQVMLVNIFNALFNILFGKSIENFVL